VDDILVVGPNANKIREVLASAARNKPMKLKELSVPTSFLGIKLEIIKGESITLTQKAYVKNILEKFKILKTLLYNTPVKTGIKLEKNKAKATPLEIKSYS
jgi:hypothetical protein